MCYKPSGGCCPPYWLCRACPLLFAQVYGWENEGVLLRAAMPTYPRLGLKQKRLILSEIWALEVLDHGVGGVGSFRGWEGESAWGLSPWWFAGNLEHFWLVEVSPWSLPSAPLSLLLACICDHISLLMKTPVTLALGAPVMPSFKLDLLCRDSVSK